MPALAAKLVQILSAAAPSQSAAEQQRLESFRASMKPELDEIAALKPRTAGMEVTATEPVFGYMANALGFKMLNNDFQVKIMNDAEPGVEETAAFEASLRTRTAKILFYNSQVTDPTTARMQAIAREAGLPVVGVTETQPPDATSYVAWMRQELDAVQAALSSKKD
jgi:zinc/manganese transport system substrate-binding protein